MGSYAAILAIGAANGVMLAWLNGRVRENRAAARLLVVLILAVVLRVSIYILGYAGAYDRWPWLTFCPLDLSLAFGPLIWAYVKALTTRKIPRRLAWHLAPAIGQFAYQSACFCLPPDVKWNWYTGPHLHVLAPITLGVGLAQLGLYLIAARRTVKAYQAWLDGRYSDGEPWRLDWLRLMLMAFAIVWLIGTGFAIWQWWIHPLTYFQRFPVMIGFCLLVYVLGLCGWRYGGVPHPAMGDVPAGAPEVLESRTSYQAMAEAWRQRTLSAGWWHDENLNLADLARHLGVSERTLSRGLHDGPGETFHSFVNRMRVDAVASRLDAGDTTDLLTIAIEAGFASKASFNRAFKLYIGSTPSAYRAGLAAMTSQHPPIASPGDR